MEKREKQALAVAIAVGAFLMSTVGFMDFYLTKVQGAAEIENRRIQMEKNDIVKVKCIDPTTEFRTKETAYLKDYNLLFYPDKKYDILSEKDGKESQQFNDASMLKIEEDLASTGCEEAKQEVNSLKDTNRWIYFKAHYKSMLFGKD